MDKWFWVGFGLCFPIWVYFIVRFMGLAWFRSKFETMKGGIRDDERKRRKE